MDHTLLLLALRARSVIFNKNLLTKKQGPHGLDWSLEKITKATIQTEFLGILRQAARQHPNTQSGTTRRIRRKTLERLSNGYLNTLLQSYALIVPALSGARHPDQTLEQLQALIEDAIRPALCALTYEIFLANQNTLPPDLRELRDDLGCEPLIYR